MDLTKFSGGIQLIMPLDHPRNMVVRDETWYKDPDGRIWRVPVGAVINGVSIPRFLWPIIGSPYVGLPRVPAVFHDYFCTVRTSPCHEVHQMFFDALCDIGVPDSKAILMFQAVAQFGPRWDENGNLVKNENWDETDYDNIGT